MKMGYWLAIVLLAAVIMPFAGVATAEETTLKGEPVDIQCYLSGQSGAGHAACATVCANKGTPIGFVTKKDGKVKMYLVMGADRKPAKDFMAAHMGKQVEVKGTITEKNGLAILTVSEVTGD